MIILRADAFPEAPLSDEDKLFLMYTGTANNGNGVEQTQCIAYSTDGIHFEKYGGNPVLRAPKEIKADCFRDPKGMETRRHVLYGVRRKSG